MIENYFVMLVTHLKSLVGMTHVIFKTEKNSKKFKSTMYTSIKKKRTRIES
jgi:hypothetical protein